MIIYKVIIQATNMASFVLKMNIVLLAWLHLYTFASAIYWC